MKTVSLLFATGLGLAPIWAQPGIKPSPVINIDIESIKEGKTAAHEKVEGEWAAILRKAGSPENYYGMAALSGTNEVWFVIPLESFAANEGNEKFSAKEPLKGAVENIDSRDGELRVSSRHLWAVYRPDLSYKPENLNLAKTRYVDLSTYRIKLGKDDDLASGAKAIFDADRKSNVDMCILGYEVTAGAPSGTFLFFGMMDSMKFLDAEPARQKAMKAGMPEAAFQQLMKGTGDVFVSMENRLFEVKPGMSYAPQAVLDADPAFWKPKSSSKGSTPVSIPGPPEQKKGQ